MISIFETEDESELKKKLSASKKTLALFYASWCHDSLSFLPIFDANCQGSKCGIIKVKIDDDENPIWDSFKIDVVPTLVLFEKGKEKMRAETKGGRILCKKDVLSFLK